MILINCFKCGKKLEDTMPESDNVPNDAVIFRAHGNYGSTIFDPMDKTFLEINICDECLVAGRGDVLMGAAEKRVVVNYTPWLPEIYSPRKE